MKNKNIGYYAPEYDKAKYYGSEMHIPAINNVLEKYTEIAKHTKQPLWYVKNAILYFTFDEEVYYISSDCIETASDEVFDRLSNQIEGDLYLAGAYDMFYAGMID